MSHSAVIEMAITGGLPTYAAHEIPQEHVAGVPIAAGILYPWFGLLLSPMIASAAMTFSSVSVIGNALRLRPVGL